LTWRWLRGGANNGDKESRRRWGEKTVVAVAVFSSLYRGMEFLSFLFFLFLSCSLFFLFSFVFFSSSCLSCSFFFSMFFCFCFSPFSFLCSPLFLFVSLLFFLLSSLPFSSLYLAVFFSRPMVFIRGKDSRESYYPCLVMAQRYGGWGGLCVVVLEQLVVLFPSASFIMVVGREGIWVESWFLGKGRGREGEIDAAKEWKKNLLPLPLCVRGRRRYTVSFKTTQFWALYIYIYIYI